MLSKVSFCLLKTRGLRKISKITEESFLVAIKMIFGDYLKKNFELFVQKLKHLIMKHHFHLKESFK